LVSTPRGREIRQAYQEASQEFHADPPPSPFRFPTGMMTQFILENNRNFGDISQTTTLPPETR
jgi:hypothetical protein